MWEKITNTDNKKKIKPVSERIKRERQDELFWFYYSEIKNLNELFMFLDVYENKLDLRKERKYNNVIKISLVLLKLLYNAKQIDEKKLTNEDLLFIRWTYIECYRFYFSRNWFNYYKNKYYSLTKDSSSFVQIPKDYDEAITASWIWQDDKKNIKERLYAKKSDISSYIAGIPFDCYCYCIQLLLTELELGEIWLNSSIPLIDEGIRSFLRDIKIDRSNLVYKESNRTYENTDDSFNAVFYSTEGDESYVSTRCRFCVKYKKQLNDKFNLLIHWDDYFKRQKKKEKITKIKNKSKK